jgi:PAS domain S-box-containing protein
MRIADDATILDANQHACQSLCYTRDELLHMTIFDFDDRWSKEQWTEHRCSLANIGAKTIETTHRRKDGTLIPVQVTINYLKHGEEGFSFYFVTDISHRVNAERERERLESQLRQAQKMEAIGSLAGGIAHDFNNILSVILGNAEILQMEEYFREPDKKCLEQIRNAGERAKQLVRQILTFSRQGKQQRVLVNLKPLIKETFEFLRSSLPTTIELKNNVCSDPALIFADPTQMQQILMNLCTNASHAMEKQGGVLTVSLENYCIGQEESEIEPDAGQGEYVRLSVEDTGNGIEPWVLNRIFDPYFTTKEPGKGTGLGLAVVHGIVKAQGGKIKVFSQVGQGAIFHIFLPRAEGLEKYEPKVVRTLSTGTERILFIDDETPLVDLGKLILERLGYQVETRTSPIDGLEAFRANPLRFDVVITDMTMPQLTGATLAKEMLRIRPDIPIILCSGYSDQINEAKAQSLGIKSYLLKPLTAQDLSEAVRGVL